MKYFLIIIYTLIISSYSFGKVLIDKLDPDIVRFTSHRDSVLTPGSIKDFDKKDTIVVEEMPEPIGGINAIMAKIVYPESCRRAGVEGKVYVIAFVNEKGTVVKTEVLRSVHPDIDKAACDAIKDTQFRPGRHKGNTVKVQVTIPVVFKLQ